MLIGVQEDFPPAVKGNIALISRGACEFGLKVAYAGASGAAVSRSSD